MSQITKTYNPEPTALEFHNDRDKYVVRLIRGCPASGKSVMCLQDMLIWAVAQEPYEGVRRTRFAVVRASYPALKTTTIKTWKNWFPEEIWPVRQSIPYDCRVKFSLEDGTKVDMEVIFIAVETDEDVKKLKSLELTGGWINEVFEVQQSIVTTMLERVGRYPPKVDGEFEGATRSGVWCDTNSPSDKHWYAKLEAKAPEGWKFYVQPAPLIRIKDAEGLTVRWDPNPAAENIRNLSGGFGYYLRQIPGLTEDQLRVNIENKFGSLFGGKGIYANEWDDAMVVAGKLHMNRGEQVLVGMDTSGLNPAAVFGQVTMGTLALLDEVLALDTAFEAFLDEIFLPMLRVKYQGCPVLAILDPSNPRDARTGQTPMQLLHARRIPAVLAPTNKPKLRIDAVKHFLKRRNGLVIDPSLTFLVDGFKGGYHFPRVRGTDNIYREEPQKNDFSHCFAAGTLVATPSGEVPIETLRVGDEVLAPSGVRHVQRAWLSRRDAAVIEVSLSSGRRIVCTPDHRFWVGSFWIRADALQYLDIITEPGSGWGVQRKSSQSNSLVSGTTDPVNRIGIHTSHRNSTCTVQCGSAIGARSQRGIRSITSTATATTIGSRTSSVFQRLRTLATTHSSAFWSSLKSRFAESPQPKRLPRSGTDPRSGGSGTHSMHAPFGLMPYRSGSLAATAGASTKAFALHTNEASVRLRAREWPARNPGLTTKTGSARSAAAGFALGATGSAAPVPTHVLAVQSLPRTVDVYDLTVEGDHAFYAEGALVHNCHDSLQYLCVHLRRGDIVTTPETVAAASHFQQKLRQGRQLA